MVLSVRPSVVAKRQRHLQILNAAPSARAAPAVFTEQPLESLDHQNGRQMQISQKVAIAQVLRHTSAKDQLPRALFCSDTASGCCVPTLASPAAGLLVAVHEDAGAGSGRRFASLGPCAPGEPPPARAAANAATQ